MNSKERLLRALDGCEVDRIPWSPFLAYFWEYQSEKIRKKGQLAFLEEIGADPLMRGADGVIPWKIDYGRCSVKESRRGDEKRTVYSTPVGDLVMEHRFTHNSWFITVHPVKTLEDVKILTWIEKELSIIPDREGLNRYLDALGNRALAIPLVGHHGKSSFQSMVESWCGTENLVYLEQDHPEEVKACLDAMYANSVETARAAASSEGKYFLSWEDTSTTNINPPLYEKYILPEINYWCDILHDEGKKYIQHACGHLKDLLPLFSLSKIDGMESVSPPPTGNIDFIDFRSRFPRGKALIGGLEPVFFENCTPPELEGEVKRLMDYCGGTPFVLANSDSCPPGVTRGKMVLVGRLVRG